MWKIAYSLEESIEIEAPLATVWDNVIFFKNMQKWSPWLVLDKNCKVHLIGKDGTLEAKYTWDSEFLGVGEEFHTEIIPNKEIKSKVIFFKPFRNTSLASFVFEEKKGKTKVTWDMHSGIPFFIFFLKNMFISMIKRDYARGLKMLKKLSETGELNTSSDIEQNIPLSSFYWIGIKNNSLQEHIGNKMSKDFESLGKVCSAKNITPLEVLTFYTKNCNMNTWLFEYIASYKVSKEDFDKMEEKHHILKWHYEATNTLKITHHGSYDFLANSWTIAMWAMRTLKLKANKHQNTFELYVNDPTQTQEKDLITEIYLPIK